MYPKPCGYSLLRHCHEEASKFEVRITNQDCINNEHTRYCKSQNLHLTLGEGKVIDIKRTMNAKPELTYDSGILGDDAVVELLGGTSVMISTPDFQLLCSGQNIYLTVSPDVSNKTCGLCGTFNRNSLDDFHLYNGGVAAKAKTFLKSWLDPELDQQPGCELGLIGLGESEPTHTVDYCSVNSQVLQSAEERASVLKDPAGPFRECLEEVSPNSFYDRAKKTGCRHSESLCDVVAGYAKACGDKGIVVGSWRDRITECAERKSNF